MPAVLGHKWEELMRIDLGAARNTDYGLVVDGQPVAPRDQLFLGTQINYFRHEADMEQSEIARRLGVDGSIPHLWEHDRRPVPQSRVRMLADALMVDVSELLTGARVIARTPHPALPVPTKPSDSKRRAFGKLLSEQPIRVHQIHEGPLSNLLPVEPEPRFPPVWHGPERVTRPLRWCNSTHTQYPGDPSKWHHHGPLPTGGQPITTNIGAML